MRIPLSYNEIDSRGLMRVLDQHANKPHGYLIEAFEQHVCELLGIRSALAVQSGTAAVHLALRMAGVKAGDAVLAPTFCYVASVSPITYCGAEPVFIDADARDWNVDVNLLGKSLDKLRDEGRRPGAIVVVHNYGYPAQMDEIMNLARERSIPVIEDAAESFMSKYKGRYTGTVGDLGVFSFNNNKTVTGLGGGMLVAHDDAVIKEARKFSTHALEEAPYYLHKQVGYNYRMSALTAAYVMAQLDRMQELLQKRVETDAYYREHLQSRGFEFQQPSSGDQVQPWLTACLLPEGAKPDQLHSSLEQSGIETRRLWNPMHLQPVFKSARSFDDGVSVKLFQRGLCLPMGGPSNRFPAFCEEVVNLLG
ncbi:MAG: aminotransferase class I/II-fold pyridoxal phosphate-dependent enzyme [Bacteroidetes bacterium]|nr:aminotransferase class I/II-fold pyridoxal phosphate-dependent enzyme [Bacteroidota bacterium]